MTRLSIVMGLLACAFGVGSVRGATVYTNDFETNTSGFSRTNTELFYNVGTRATQSRFLGRFVAESVTLSLSGLTPGREHTLGFDLYIGGTWAGNNPTNGLDQWRLTAGGVTLIDTTFSNTKSTDSVPGGNPRTQNYSDATPNGPTAQPAFTGADQVYDVGFNAAADFAIYYFGRGAGNPTLTFIPLGSSIDIVFSGAGRLGSSDIWALDNVRVETEDLPVEVVPTPGAAAAGMGLLAMVGWRRRRRENVESVD